jgi:threonine dehydrogenase-like Zn-dependent dehydrogenase
VDVVAQEKSPLLEPRIALPLAFIAVVPVLCGVAAADDPAGTIGLVSVVVTGLGMVGLFFIPAAGSRQLPDVCRRAPTRRTGPDGPGAARP